MLPFRCVLLVWLLLLPALSAAAVPPLIVLDPGHGGANAGASGPKGMEEKEITLAIANRVRQLLTERSEVRVALSREDDSHLGLRERAEVANRLQAALLLSIHCNSAPHDRARGHETFFLDASSAANPVRTAESEEPKAQSFQAIAPIAKPAVPPLPASPPEPLSEAAAVAAITAELRDEIVLRRSEQLAIFVQQELTAGLVGPSRGVRQAGFDVLLHSRVPSVVAEVGFVNHPVEGLLLADPGYRERIASALTLAILRFLTPAVAAAPGAPAAGGPR